jgi:hypothetical protein
MSPRRSLGYVMLEWTCPNCSTRNPGPQKTCRSCGAPQPENVQFERAAEEKLVADQGAVSAAQAGADFICPYCSTRNRGDAQVCVQCGGDLAEARRRASGAELQPNAAPPSLLCSNCGKENPSSSTSCSRCGAPLPRLAAPAAPASVPAASRAANAPAPGRPSGRKKWLLVGGIGAALLICCIAAIVVFFIPTASLQARVTDVHWQTSVPVQAQREVQHNNEEGNPPGDAYDVSCHNETNQVCTEKVVDQGNGYGEKVQDCQDVTKNFCSYTVKEWQTIQTYTLDGHDYTPVYSQPSLSLDQRLGSQSVDYTVYFDTEKGQKTYSPSALDEFARFQPGSAWTLKLNTLGAVIGVSP